MKHQICVLKLRQRANATRSRNATLDGPDSNFISISYCNVLELVQHNCAINNNHDVITVREEALSSE